MENRTAGEIWAQAGMHLAERLQKDVYDRWIRVIDAEELTDQALTLSVANDFYQSWLEENYLPLIEDAVAATCGERLKIAFLVDPAKNPPVQAEAPVEAPSRKPSARAGAKPAHSGKPLNPKYTFDTFVVGPSNSFSHAAAVAVAQSPARAYNPLFVYGGVGLGKTHLMQAVGHAVITRKTHSVCYITSETFLNDYIDALQHKALVQFRKKYRDIDLLLIDDIQFLAGKERIQEEFFHTFNTLYESHKQIVLTCDRPASEIPGLEQRLVSRFEWGLVTELETPDVETRVAIIRKKEEQFGLRLPDEVSLYIAEHIRSNIRSLEGALIRVASYASLTGRPMTMQTVDYLLRDAFDKEKREALTLEAVQRTVAEYYDLRMGDMTSKQRPQSIAFPRQVAMYLCRTMTPNSLPVIGNAFGRNHATVLHACRHVEKKIQNDASVRQAVTVLRQRLGQR